MLARALAIAVLLAETLASAQTPLESDRDRASNHAHVAQLLYARGDYAGALRECETARSLVPVPELDYDIAQCLARLGRNAEAADAFERYVAARPDDSNNVDTRARIAELRRRASASPTANAVVSTPGP